MRSTESRRKWAWVGLWFGVIYGVIVALLLIAGVLAPGLWFTVVAMVLLAVSQGLVLRSISREERQP
ncbi:hypothetical protein ACU6RU_09030 [Microbacterium sp. F1-18]